MPQSNAAVRPHGRMRDGPKGRSPLRHAKPSRGGRKALAEVDVQVTPLPITKIAFHAFDLTGGFRTSSADMESQGALGGS